MPSMMGDRERVNGVAWVHSLCLATRHGNEDVQEGTGEGSCGTALIVSAYQRFGLDYIRDEVTLFVRSVSLLRFGFGSYLLLRST